MRIDGQVFKIEVAGVHRELPLMEVKPGLRIAVLNILGDTELVQAAATAQGTLANITSDFINNVGLQDDGSGNLSARTVDFKYQKPVKTTTTCLLYTSDAADE